MIEVRDLWKSFGPQPVLRGTCLRIEKGEAVVIIGRSGGGKSVLLKHLIALLQPDRGQVRVEGQDLCCLDERQLLHVRRKFGMLFQMAALFDSLTVYENVSFVLQRERKHTEGEMRKLVAEALAMVELPGIEEKKPAELSGAVQRVLLLGLGRHGARIGEGVQHGLQAVVGAVPVAERKNGVLTIDTNACRHKTPEAGA